MGRALGGRGKRRRDITQKHGGARDGEGVKPYRPFEDLLTELARAAKSRDVKRTGYIRCDVDIIHQHQHQHQHHILFTSDAGQTVRTDAHRIFLWNKESSGQKAKWQRCCAISACLEPTSRDKAESTAAG